MRIGFLILDLVIITLAWVVSCHFVIGPKPLSFYFIESRYALPVLYAVKIIFFTRMGLYRAILRYASFPFARTIVKSVTMGSFFSYLIINYPAGNWPFGLLTMDWLITLFFVGCSRFLPRYYTETSKPDRRSHTRILIYGAGDLGDAVARNFLRNNSEFYPVGFIDDDSKKIGKKVHNLPVLGNRGDLAKILKREKVNELVIAITNIPPDRLRDLIKECRTYRVFCRIAPKISDMMSHDVSIKNIDIADLLKRDPKDLDEKQIDRFLRRKKILITGAAGSIGSELVRQALHYRPKKLVVIDNSEYGLYKIEEELRETIEEKKPYCRFKFILQDICQAGHMDRILESEKPDIVFHAAAYKHVPLLETNPFTGVLNNIQGTMNIANAADRHGVEKFIMISTDKAVHPTNVMGATKRICELYIQNLNLRSKAEYVAVRFGNVLGSSGSVIPKFLDQIKKGGAVTVTHPDVTRYFMLTQEAVALVMQAASIGHGGEIFILNMGQPVKIKEMAEDLIFLAGKEPYRDIDIRFIGLRPGEKLYEELLIDETEKKTQYENITIGKMTVIDWDLLNSRIASLLAAAKASEDKGLLLSCIKALVPGFNHIDLPQSEPETKVFSLPFRSPAYSTNTPTA